MIINDKIVIISKPTPEELGIRLRMKAYIDGFKEFLDTSYIYLESYTEDNEIRETFVIKSELSTELEIGLREFTKRNKKKILMRATLIR